MTGEKLTLTWMGNEIAPKIGSFIKPDYWPTGERLTEGDSFSTFRIPVSSDGPIKSLAVEIQVTGRTVQRKSGNYHVRVKITFPGDGEPDTVTHGWMMVE